MSLRLALENENADLTFSVDYVRQHLHFHSRRTIETFSRGGRYATGG